MDYVTIYPLSLPHRQAILWPPCEGEKVVEARPDSVQIRANLIQ
ncbi:MAG: hypothetical protein ACI9FN_003796 [Saprospiraceae bacterium]